MRIGTRGSALALAQAGIVRARLAALGVDVEIVTIRTEGDRLVDRHLAEVGGKGLFVREIETALLEKRIDAAVHSLKDLPAEVPHGLVLAAYPPRDDARDVLVGTREGGLDALRRGAKIGTSSPRRRALLLSLRRDLRVEPLRGNVDTRLRKLAAGEWDAVVLAAAGVARLRLDLRHATPLDPDVFVPAVGQGMIAIEARDDDPRTLAALKRIDDADARACAEAERAFLARLGASCVTPMAAHARLHGAELDVVGIVLNDDGGRVLRATARGARETASALGTAIADDLLRRGAAELTPLRPGARR
jgi:hydroxymethylbilane synthase